jgi:hypothetical protein
MPDEFAVAVEHAPPSETLQRYGVAKIPGLLPAETMAQLQRLAANIYDVIAREVDRGSALDPELRNSFLQWHGVALAALPGFLRRYEPDLVGEFREIVGRVRDGVHRQVTAGNGFWPRWRILPSASYLRRHRDTSAYVPWHIDADAAGTAAVSGGCFNVWLPLEDVGSGAPSLQLIPGSHRQMRSQPLLQNTDWPYRTEEWVAQRVQGKLWTPMLQAGDAIVFDQYTLHRTQRGSVAKPTRTSCEFRFVNIPHSWLPLAHRALKVRAKRLAAAIASRGRAPAE